MSRSSPGFIAEAINFDRDGGQRGREGRAFVEDGTLSFTFPSVVSSHSFPVSSLLESLANFRWEAFEAPKP